MKKLLLAFIICLFCVSQAWGITKIIDLPLATDLLDDKSTLAAGEIKRVSAATYIHDGVLYTADGDSTPFSHSSVEDETGATEMRGSFVDGQAWFHDAGGLVAVYAGTGNLLKIDDGIGKLGYGFLGEVGTGEALGAESLDDPGLTDAAEWNDTDGNITQNAGAGTVTWDGAGAGAFFTVDGAGQFTVGKLYKIVVVVDVQTAGNLYMVNTNYAFQSASAALWTAAATYTLYKVCTNDLGFALYGNSVCDAVVSNISIKQVTEPNANAVHIYKEHGLLNEGWNAIDTGIDYNVDTAWDFDVYVNLMSSTGGTAEARFEDGWLLVEPEGTNLIPYSEDFSQWTASEVTLDTSQADPMGATGATGLAASGVAGNHYVYIKPTIADNANNTFSIFTKAGAKDWISLSLGVKSGSWPFCYFQLTGDGATGTNNTTKENIERLGNTDWYRCRITHNVGAGATATNVYIYSAEADNDKSFTGDGSTIDTYVYGAQVEQTLFLTSYIPTNGIPVTRTTEAGNAADNGYSWTITQPLKNILDDAEPVGSPTDSEGTLVFDVKWGCDESDIAAGNNGLIVSMDAYFSLAYFSNATFFTFDSTDSSGLVHPAFSSGDIIAYASRWGDVDSSANKLSAGLREADGTWSFDATPADYDGNFTLGTDLRLSFPNLYPIHIRNIEFWDDAFEKVKTVISGAGATHSYDIVDTTSSGHFDALQVTASGHTFKNYTIVSPYGIGLDADESVTVINSIIKGTGKDVDVANLMTITANNVNTVNHANATDSIGDGTYTATNCQFAQDPLFVDEAGQDFNLQSTSPCINRGTETGLGNQTDYDGSDLFGAVDMGGEEYQQAENALWFHNVSGNDSNTSITSSVPLETFSHLSDLGLADGCTIYLHNGAEWPDDFDAPSPGFSGGEIVLKPYGGDGPAILTGTTLTFGEEYWTLEKIILR